ncbi:hypothetical protein M758_10G152800, partial [Ceratodon purpureus]
ISPRALTKPNHYSYKRDIGREQEYCFRKSVSGTKYQEDGGSEAVPWQRPCCEHHSSPCQAKVKEKTAVRQSQYSTG